MNAEKDWKLKLRNGKLQTPFRHYTAIAAGVVGQLAEGFTCRPGSALMAVKTWASSMEQSSEMVTVIGGRIGFNITGAVRIYETEPSQPPEDVPTGYDLSITPVDTKGESEAADGAERAAGD